MSPSPSTSTLSKIFISYRRSESAAHAGRLSDQLATHFGSQIIFIDIESIEPGRDFVEAIEDAVGSCKILLALIGQQWLTCDNEHGRRLDDPNDFVRLEIAAALKRGVRVIPVLIQGAAMPREQDLPDELAPLARRQAWEVRDLSWKEDIRKLIGKIEGDVSAPPIDAESNKIPLLLLTWVQLIIANYLFFAVVGALIGLILGIIYIILLLPLSIITSRLVNRNNVLSILIGGLFAAMIEGGAAHLTGAGAARYGIIYGAFFGASLTLFFSKEYKYTNLFWASISTLLLIAIIVIPDFAEYGVIFMLEMLREGIEYSLQGAVMTIIIGLPTLMLIRPLQRFIEYFIDKLVGVYKIWD